MKKRIYFLPKTRIGKISFYITITAFIGIYLQYWLSISGIVNSQLVLPGLLMGAALIICGIASFIAIKKYRDYAVSLFISALIGLLGILFVIGEFAIPH